MIKKQCDGWSQQSLWLAQVCSRRRSFFAYSWSLRYSRRIGHYEICWWPTLVGQHEENSISQHTINLRQLVAVAGKLANIDEASMATVIVVIEMPRDDEENNFQLNDIHPNCYDRHALSLSPQEEIGLPFKHIRRMAWALGIFCTGHWVAKSTRPQKAYKIQRFAS